VAGALAVGQRAVPDRENELAALIVLGAAGSVRAVLWLEGFGRASELHR
jgi:hypothetical protein